MSIFGRKRNKEYEQAVRLLADGQVDDAIRSLRIIVDENPGFTNALTSLGVAMIQSLGENKEDGHTITEALEFLDRAASTNPKDPVPVFNKAVCLRELGRPNDAITAFEHVLELEERFALAILHMAEINYELENYEEAVDLARLAAIRDPSTTATMSWVRDAMEKAGLLDEDGNPIDKPEGHPKMF
ncbi:MAG: tetratricopeptide repeat protein [Candidatus Thorarchaeota archaeon]|nr:tetratricopeptide repeat protein [Candidatus Thorarchaeota archaeon]